MKLVFQTKHIVLLLLFIAGSFGQAFACELCKQNQPKPLQNITHGTGPQSDWDYLIIIIGIIIVTLTLFYSIKLLVKPQENRPEHIKHIVVNTSLNTETLV
ncbi:hypothetical protein [Marinoscillum luteum]|uniref:Uncharacterized protein n=1 Tax=Marinoscillum luteum TaxID=861051 RepID=A0ABW7NDZ4_9BACT